MIAAADPNLKTNGILARLPPQKLNLLIGEITSLLMASRLHRGYQVRDIADIVLPAVNVNQFIIYRDGRRRPIAFVTWGRLSAEVEAAYLSGQAVLSESELTSGDRLYFLDFIAPYGHARKVIRELRTKVFPDERGRAIRVSPSDRFVKRLRFRGAKV
ncbi:MAG TPA: toxin-activating lysine-acyltransferase [Asticcacaulis sp.]|nr:toxin-activating lysine-acyltransferase [Asticcacaulis sp.]